MASIEPVARNSPFDVYPRVAWEADVHTGLWAASRNPARCAGLSDRSVIAEGLLADMVELDDHWQVRGTWVAGQRSG
jgi:alpha-D-ribose 1-methylphosphonate 5-triphosphate diphosphatase PhnM